MVSLNGKICSLSHIFRVQNGPFFIIEVENNGEVYYVFNKKKDLLFWHSLIELGSHYTLSGIIKTHIYKDTHNIEVYVTSSKSTLTLVNKAVDVDVLLSWDNLSFDVGASFSYKGRISAITNDELGIYEVDDNIVLILSYLKDLTAEIWSPSKYTESENLRNNSKNDLDSNQSVWDFQTAVNVSRTPVCDSEEMDFDMKRPFLKIGDEVSIYNAHATRKNNKIYLICCGRSLVRTKRTVDDNLGIVFSLGGALHCVHRYNYGLDFVLWLLSLEETLTRSLLPSQKYDWESVTRRDYRSQKGILYAYVDTCMRHREQQSRALALEFILESHDCVVSREFSEVSPITISGISDILKADWSSRTQSKSEALWNFSFVSHEESRNSLVGEWGVSPCGFFNLKTKNESLIVVVTGDTRKLFEFDGQVVAVFNFDMVEEVYNVYGESLKTDRYIIVPQENIKLLFSNSKSLKSKTENNVLDNRIQNDLNPKHSMVFFNNSDENSNLKYGKRIGVVENHKIIAKSHFKIKILSISRLYFNKYELNMKKIKGFYIVRANIHTKTNDDSSEPVFIRINNSNVGLYPYLSEMSEIQGLVNSDQEFRFRRTILLNGLPGGGPLECVDLPIDLHIEKIQSLPLKGGMDSIKCILEGGLSSQGIVSFNIEGRIVQKKFLNSKYEPGVSVNCVNNCIGVPGNKVISLLIQDIEEPEHQIWVYLSNDCQSYLSQRELGLITNAEIHLSALKRCVSSKKSIYLSSTNFTKITLIRLSSTSTKIGFKTRQFISNIYHLPAGSVVLIFGSMTTVVEASIKGVCPSCMSEVERGRCTYVGCHSEEAFSLGVSATLLVEDGSGAVYVYIKNVDQFRLIFQITDYQWKLLREMVVNSPLVFKNRTLEDSSTNVKLLASLLRLPKNFRTLKMNCRIFPKKESAISSTINVFAIDVKPIDLMQDVALLK